MRRLSLKEPEQAAGGIAQGGIEPAGIPPERRALMLERLEVRRVPGFRRGGFTLEALSPGVNVIYGPNGSGKSTAARAIEKLLWPAETLTPEDELFGRFQLAGETWTAEAEGKRWAWQREGRPADRPAFPGELARRRYHLSLTELLRADDRIATLLGCLLTLTPGTVAIDYLPEAGLMYIHALDADDAGEVEAGVREIERRLLRWLDAGESPPEDNPHDE